MEKIVVDGKGAVFGRISSFVAKELLKGNYVDLINCDEIIVSGKREVFVEKLKKKMNMGRGGSLKGPKYIREEDMLVKRMIRGMLPWDRAKGREAFKRLRCYKSGDYKLDEKTKVIKKFEKDVEVYSTIKEIVESLK